MPSDYLDTTPPREVVWHLDEVVEGLRGTLHDTSDEEVFATTASGPTTPAAASSNE